jgi:hemerythrin superfamily protein
MTLGTDLLRTDHELVDTLFTRFEETGDASLVGRIIDMLTAHDQAEHAALYPLVTVLLGSDAADRSEVAHMLVKRQIDLVRSLEGPPLLDAVQTLRLLVADHVVDEEANILPQLETTATPDQLEGLAARIEQNKQRVG